MAQIWQRAPCEAAPIKVKAEKLGSTKSRAANWNRCQKSFESESFMLSGPRLRELPLVRLFL
jgi:hypothetical protein